MRILFIGGTRFVGQAMVADALARGHQVDVFHRGKTQASGLAGARHLIGDRMRDLSALAEGEWDAVVDTCGYRPPEIDLLAQTLQGRAGRHLFVSSVSVYADDIPHDANENAARRSTSVLDGQDLATIAVNGDTYGALKVLCEDAVAAAWRDALVLRPTYIVGPHDYTPRFPEWVKRLAAGGVIDAPGPREAAVQYVDARDLGRFAIALLEQGAAGTYNVASPPVPYSFGDLLEGIAKGVAPAGAQLRWLTVEEAKASSQAFPLWHGGASMGIAAVNCDAARAHGFAARPLAETAADTMAWLQEGSPT